MRSPYHSISPLKMRTQTKAQKTFVKIIFIFIFLYIVYCLFRLKELKKNHILEIPVKIVFFFSCFVLPGLQLSYKYVIMFYNSSSFNAICILCMLIDSCSAVIWFLCIINKTFGLTFFAVW